MLFRIVLSALALRTAAGDDFGPSSVTDRRPGVGVEDGRRRRFRAVKCYR
jgi:hypothetical protein